MISNGIDYAGRNSTRCIRRFNVSKVLSDVFAFPGARNRVIVNILEGTAFRNSWIKGYIGRLLYPFSILKNFIIMYR